MRLVSAVFCFLVAACGASASITSPHEEEVVSATPSKYAIAASVIFLGCPKEAEDIAKCFACDVTLHDTDEGGLVAYASHWEHELKPWENRDSLQVSVSGEVANTKYEASRQTKDAAMELFETAEAWCSLRGKGSYHLLKNDIDTEFGGAE